LISEEAFWWVPQSGPGLQHRVSEASRCCPQALGPAGLHAWAEARGRWERLCSTHRSPARPRPSASRSSAALSFGSQEDEGSDL